MDPFCSQATHSSPSSLFNYTALSPTVSLALPFTALPFPALAMFGHTPLSDHYPPASSACAVGTAELCGMPGMSFFFLSSAQHSQPPPPPSRPTTTGPNPHDAPLSSSSGRPPVPLFGHAALSLLRCVPLSHCCSCPSSVRGRIATRVQYVRYVLFYYYYALLTHIPSPP